MEYSVDSVMFNMENGKSIDFYMNEIQSILNESCKLKESDEMFKKIKPSWVPATLMDLFTEINVSSKDVIPRTIRKNNEKVEIISKTILEYAKKHHSKEEATKIKENLEAIKNMTVKQLIKYLEENYQDNDKVLIDTSTDGGFSSKRDLLFEDIQRELDNSVILTTSY